MARAKVVRDNHIIANVKAFDSTADAVNVADAFMAHDPAGLGATAKAVVDMQICTADGSRAEADDGVSFVDDSRHWACLDTLVVRWALPCHRKHGTVCERHFETVRSNLIVLTGNGCIVA